MKTGDLFKKDKSAYELDAQLGGIGGYIDEEGNEILSVLPRFSFNAANMDKYKNADLLTFSPGFNMLNFKVGGSYPAAIGTSGVGHTATFSTIPSLLITNPSGMDEYQIYISPNPNVAPIQLGGQIYRQAKTPNFKNNYIAENPNPMYFTVRENDTLITVRAGLRAFCPVGTNNSGQKIWSDLYLVQTKTFVYISESSGLEPPSYLILRLIDSGLESVPVSNYYEVDNFNELPDPTFKTSTIFGYVSNENKVYKKEANGTDYVVYPSVVIAQYQGKNNNIVSLDPMQVQGKSPVWFDNSKEPEVAKLYNPATTLWEDFDYIYAGYVKLTSSAANALIQAVVSNPYNFNQPQKQYTRFCCNDGRKNSKGEADFVVADLLNSGLSINETGYVSPWTTTGSNVKLTVPPYYTCKFFPTGKWEMVFDIVTTSAAPAANGTITNCPSPFQNIALNYNTNRTILVYLSTNGTSWDLANASPSTALAASTRYLMKLSYDLTNYKLEISTQLTNPVWSTIWSLTSNLRVFVPPKDVAAFQEVFRNIYNTAIATPITPLLQMGMYLENCYFKDGDIKVWEGKNWKRVTALAPFKYTDTAGVTRIQASNISAQIQGNTGYQNFVIEDGQLKPVGIIYRQPVEPDFVRDKSQIMLQPFTPTTFSGNTITIKAGMKTLAPQGLTKEGYRIWTELDVDSDISVTNTVAGSNIASTLILQSEISDNTFDNKQVKLVTKTTASVTISDTAPTKTGSIMLHWYCPKDNLFRVRDPAIANSDWVIVTASILGTYTSTSTNVSNLVLNTPQNGYPLWFDTSCEPYECYSYDPGN